MSGGGDGTNIIVLLLWAYCDSKAKASQKMHTSMMLIIEKDAINFHKSIVITVKTYKIC